MTGLTHLAAGTSAGLFLSIQTSLSIPQTILVTGAAMAGSLFPDIDNASSKIGNRIKPASILIQLFFGHRTVFHAPLLYVTALFVITARYPQHQTLAAGFLIGVLSHLILDMMNPAGIPLLWPMRKRFAIPVVHSGSIFDRILGVALWILAGTLIVAALFS